MAAEEVHGRAGGEPHQGSRKAVCESRRRRTEVGQALNGEGARAAGQAGLMLGRYVGQIIMIMNYEL